MRRNWSDRIKTLKQPLFPGYLFCRSPYATLGSVLRTPGIIRIISFGRKPYPVSDDKIESLRASGAIREGQVLHPMPGIGQKVEIKTGPLTGVVGIIMKFKNRDRLVLSVDAIMKSVAIDIEACEVAAVGPAPMHH